MIFKPVTCEGCPFYELSAYFTPDSIVPNAEVAILAQAPGRHEEQGLKLEGKHYGQELTTRVTPQPLIGASGNWLRREFWPQTGLEYDACSKLNVIKCRPYNSNDLPSLANTVAVRGITTKQLKEAIVHCSRAHLNFPDSTKHILAMGEIALYTLTGEELLNYRLKETEVDVREAKSEKRSTVTEWRGWVLGKDKDSSNLAGLFDYYNPGSTSNTVNIFPVLHIASLLHGSKLYRATKLDFWRFGQLVAGKWPKPLPEVKVNHLPSTLPRVLGFDTEYTQDRQLIMWSLADVERNSYVITDRRELPTLVPGTRIITQNGNVDIPHLEVLLPPGTVLSDLTIEDCMYAWAVIHAGEPTGLDYQLSTCGSYNRHKHLRNSPDKETQYLYAGLDADTTLNDSWKHLYYRFQRDRLLKDEYYQRRLPLLPIIRASQERGVQPDAAKVALVKSLMDQEIARIAAEAVELTAIKDFNIKSNHDVRSVLYGSARKAVKVSKKQLRLEQQGELFKEYLEAVIRSKDGG